MHEYKDKAKKAETCTPSEAEAQQNYVLAEHRLEANLRHGAIFGSISKFGK
jgi:hypothetical protein